MLPDLTVQELNAFLTNIYEGSTANASINMELLVLLGLIGPCKPQQTFLARPNKTVIVSSAKTNNTNEDPSALPRKTHSKNNSKTLQKLILEPDNEQDNDSGGEAEGSLDPLDINNLKKDYDELDNGWTDSKILKYLKKLNSKIPEDIKVKIKEENQDNKSDEISDSGTSENITVREERKRNKMKKKIRFAEDPIWAHVTNISCTENNFSRGSVSCNYCEKTFQFDRIVSHIWAMHKIMVERPSRFKKPFVEKKRAAYWEHFSVDPENKFRCICQLCGKNLSQNSATKHLRQRHSVGEPIPCSFCGKSFRDSNTKKTHELTHTKSYQYFCSVCGKGFYENWQLSDHVKRIHDESIEKAFQCSDCGKAFKLKRDLHTHNHTAHNPAYINKKKKTKKEASEKVYTEEEIAKKPHLCSICKKRFSKEDYFKLHMKIHSGEAKVECEVCKKTFADAYYLKAHMKTVHSDERPFSCSVCLKNFKHKKTLQSHMVIHTGEKPYQCQRCEKSFAWKSLLNYHNTHNCLAVKNV